MDSSDNYVASDEGDSDSHDEVTTSNRNDEQGQLEVAFGDGIDGEDAFCTLGWSRFTRSADRLKQYMEEATAEIRNTADLVPLSPRQQRHVHHRSGVAADEKAQCATKSPLATNNISSRDAKRLNLGTIVPVAESNGEHSSTDALTGTTVNRHGRSAPCSEQDELSAGGSDLSMDHTGGHGSAPNGPTPLAPTRQFALDLDDSVNSDNGVVRSDCQTRTNDLLDKACVESSPPSDFSPRGNPIRRAVLEVCAGQTSSGMESNRRENNSLPVAIARVSAAGASQTSELELLSPQHLQTFFGDVSGKIEARDTKAKPELPESTPSFLGDCCFVRQQETAIMQEINKLCGCMKGEILVTANNVIQADVMASVGEAAVAQRIAHDKAKAVQARRQQREDELDR